MARSGQVWENYFHPGNSEIMGYTALQRTHPSDYLKEIDDQRHYLQLSTPVSEIAKSLVADYALQSVQLEGNLLGAGDSVSIDNILNEDLFRHIDLATMPVQKLPLLEIPEIPVLQGSHQVAELTNHTVISRWIAEVAASAPGTPGLSENEIKILSALTLRNTGSEVIYTSSWGKRIALGDYRSLPISVTSNHLRIFPYHIEVPALMERFIHWRDQNYQKKELHPLIAACQIIAYFLHIHPFPDGNGRIGRILMQDYLIRQGYLPIVMPDVERGDYIQMVSDAQDGNPEKFVLHALGTQLDMMRAFQGRQHVWPKRAC